MIFNQGEPSVLEEARRLTHAVLFDLGQRIKTPAPPATSEARKIAIFAAA